MGIITGYLYFKYAYLYLYVCIFISEQPKIQIPEKKKGLSRRSSCFFGVQVGCVDSSHHS